MKFLGFTFILMVSNLSYAGNGGGTLKTIDTQLNLQSDLQMHLVKTFKLNTDQDSMADFIIYSANEQTESFQQLKVPVKSLHPTVLDSLKKSQQLQDWVELQSF